MVTAETLMATVGAPVDSDAVQALIAADDLTASTEPDLQEGEPPRSYLSGPAAGYELMHWRGRVATLYLYAEPAGDFAAFPGALPGGLRRGASRPEVLARFGVPERSGGAARLVGLGPQGAWDRFAVGGLCLHFQYAAPGERIRLVTVMAAGEVP